MKILLKSIFYVLASLLFFGICSRLFPGEEYGGESPSEDFVKNGILSVTFIFVLHTSVFIYLFYQEFAVLKMWSILLCFFLHCLMISLGFYLIIIIFYDFLMENYPDLSYLISETDQHNDEFPSTFYILFSLGGFMIFATWGSISGLKKIINKRKNNSN